MVLRKVSGLTVLLGGPWQWRTSALIAPESDTRQRIVPRCRKSTLVQALLGILPQRSGEDAAVWAGARGRKVSCPLWCADQVA